MDELLQKFLSQLRSSLRFRWYGVVVAWVFCLCGWSLVAWLPNIYEASARVFVDTSSVLTPVLGEQIVSLDVETQLDFVRDNLLGSERLEFVATEVGLFGGAISPRERETVISSLGDEILISTEARQGSARTNDIYTISYRHEDRSKAIAVVRTLYDGMAEDMLAAQREGNDTRQRFISDELNEMELELQQAEQALAAFKREHADRLPGTEGDYFTRMQAERDELADLRRELRVLEARRAQITQQLEGEAIMVGRATGLGQELRADSIDAKIRDARIRLDALLVEFTENHPDVIAQTQVLEQYEAQRDAQLDALGVAGSGQELAGLEINRVREELEIALSEAEIEIATLREDINLSQARVDELLSLIEEVPDIEAELARLNRDYDVKMELYLELARSRETEELSRQASETDQIDFRPVNPPNAPLAPVAPSRPLLLAAVFAVALGAGGALCFLLAQLSPVFGSARELQDRLGLPVIGQVAQAWQENLRRKRLRSAISFAMALSLLFAVFAGAVLIEIAGPGIHSIFQGRLA